MTPDRFVNAIVHWLEHWWNAEREKSKAADWFTAVLSVVIAGAAIWSACIFQDQLTEARRYTEVSERPWLTVQAVADNGLVFEYGQQAELEITFSVNNVGHSPAKDVQIDAKMFPSVAIGQSDPEAIRRQQQEVCDSPKVNDIGKFDLFPIPEPTKQQKGISVLPSDIATKAIPISTDKNRKFVGFYVVGCVSYRFSFDTKYHQTFFAYDLLRIVPWENGKILMLSNGTPLMQGFEVGVSAPQKEVSLINDLFGRNDAY